MILCHFALVHAFQGGFFGWAGVLGALAPDLMGITGWISYFRADIKIVGDDWWDYMTDFSQSLYQAMHSVWFFVLVLFLEMTVRYFIFTLTLGTGCSFIPSFSIGYLTHIVADLFTHRRRLGMFVLIEDAGPVVGIHWFKSKFYWTEIAGLALCFVVAWLGPQNIVINSVIGLFQ